MPLLSKRRIAVFAAQVLTVIGLIVAWQLLVQFNIVSDLLVAPPSVVFPNFWAILHYNPPGGSADVPFGIVQSMSIVAAAVVIAVLAGVILGVTIGSVTFLRNVLEEYIVAFYALPKVTLLPFFWILFGLSIRYRLAYAALDATFPIMLIMIYATRSVDPALMKMAKAVGASRTQRIFKIFFPSIIPSFMGGIRIGFVSAFIGVILAEMFVGNTGIGYLVRNFTDIFATTLLYGVILAVIIISVAVNISLLAIEKYLTRWKTMAPA